MKRTGLIKTEAFQPAQYKRPVFPLEVRTYLATMSCYAETDPDLGADGKVLSDCCDQFPMERNADLWNGKPTAAVYQAFQEYLRRCKLPASIVEGLDTLYQKYRGGR